METHSNALAGIWVGEHPSGFSAHTVTLEGTERAIRGQWVIEPRGQFADAQRNEPGRRIEVTIEGQEVSPEGFRFAWGGGDSASMEFRILGEGRAVLGPVLAEAQALLPGVDIGRAVEGHRVYLTRRESNAG